MCLHFWSKFGDWIRNLNSDKYRVDKIHIDMYTRTHTQTQERQYQYPETKTYLVQKRFIFIKWNPYDGAYQYFERNGYNLRMNLIEWDTYSPVVMLIISTLPLQPKLQTYYIYMLHINYGRIMLVVTRNLVLWSKEWNH